MADTMLPIVDNDPAREWLPTDDSGRHLPRIDVAFADAMNGRDVYSYAWGGTEILRVGDIVKVPRPTNWIGSYAGRSYAEVVNLRSGYEGPVRTITELVRRGSSR